MIVELGHFALALALAVTLVQAIVPLVGAGRGWSDWMRMAVPTALGVAIARPDRRVLCLTGDGEMMMGVGSLSVVGAQAPQNLSILVLDNEHFGETGRQPGLAETTDLCALAGAAGLRETMLVTAMEQIDDLTKLLFETPGPTFAVAKIALTQDPLLLPEKDGAIIARRFQEAAARGA